MAFDSSDSDENLIKNYDPHVELPAVIPITKTPIKESNLTLEKNSSKSLDHFEVESESSSEFNFDLYKPIRKKNDESKKRSRRNREKDTLNFKPAPIQKEKNAIRDDSDEDFEKLHDQEVAPEDLPDVVMDDDSMEEEEEDKPLVNEDWKSKNVMSRPVQRRADNGNNEVPHVKKPNPRIGRVMRKKPTPPSNMNVSTSSPNFQITPPDGTRRPRPVPKKKHKISDAEPINDKESSKFGDSDSSSNPAPPPRPKKKPRKLSQPEQESESDGNQQKDDLSLQDKIHKAISKVQESSSLPDMQTQMRMALQNPKIQYLEEQAQQQQQQQQVPQIVKVILTYTDFIGSIEYQGSITKRTFVKLFENTKPLFSVKFKNALVDGNFNVSIGANAHISKGSHYATIIVANDKTDFSLRKGSFEGQELVTIRTTVNKREGRSGHAIFIHGIPGTGPIDLVGYWTDSSTLTFKEKYSNQVFGVFGLLSATTINAKCSQFIDSVRCLAICFALFMTNK